MNAARMSRSRCGPGPGARQHPERERQAGDEPGGELVRVVAGAREAAFGRLCGLDRGAARREVSADEAGQHGDDRADDERGDDEPDPLGRVEHRDDHREQHRGERPAEDVVALERGALRPRRGQRQPQEEDPDRRSDPAQPAEDRSQLRPRAGQGPEPREDEPGAAEARREADSVDLAEPERRRPQRDAEREVDQRKRREDREHRERHGPGRLDRGHHADEDREERAAAPPTSGSGSRRPSRGRGGTGRRIRRPV
jgi:hypothetical protein